MNLWRRWMLLGLIVFLSGVMGLLAQEPATDMAIRPSDFITLQEGELPIILSAPHGGSKALPNVPARKGEGFVKGPSGFFTGRDTGTEELTHAIALAIEKRLGRKPYFVIAQFHRRYIDANRPVEIAVEHPDAKTVYLAYRDALDGYCKKVVNKHRAGLLLDIHGQGSAKDVVFRGTQNGETVALLRKRFGDRAHTGPDSFFGLLQANGCKVFPTEEIGKEQAGFTGGHIVRTYGGENYGMDAIQLEFGGDYRNALNRQQTADRVARAVEGYTQRYLRDALPSPAPVKVAVYVGKGASASRQNVFDALQPNKDYQLDSLSEDDIRAGKLKHYQCLIVPGGSGSAQGEALGADGREQIKKFVHSGGNYVGICAGSYLATNDYTWSLGILNAKVIDKKHWNRGNGTVKISLSKDGQGILRTADPAAEIIYRQGPLLAAGDSPVLPAFRPLATYESEIAKNGAPEGVMKGTVAIATAPYGRGNVLVYSPHPERAEFSHHLLIAGMNWLRDRARE